MGIAQSLAALSLQPAVKAICQAADLAVAAGVVGSATKILLDRFTNHSERLAKALKESNRLAFSTLELALAGTSWWSRASAMLATAESKAFADRIRAMLLETSLAEGGLSPDIRQACLDELREARKKGLLEAGLSPTELAGPLAEFADPANVVRAESTAISRLGTSVQQAGYPRLATLLVARTADNPPLIVVAARYFFRRAVERDGQLFQGLTFDRLEGLSSAQEQGFAAVQEHLGQVESLLRDVAGAVVQTHSAVLEMREQLNGQSEQLRQVGQAVQTLLDRYQLQQRDLRSTDSLSIRSDDERQLVKELVSRYRAVPARERRAVPALLDAIGRLELVAGEFEGAQQAFRELAHISSDTAAQAKAHFHAYRVALERRDWAAAFESFAESVKLAPNGSHVPFPLDRYIPQRILGAGGFGVVFLCRHRFMEADVVVKALDAETLQDSADRVFSEAKVLRELEHPSIIRISECGYMNAEQKSRPYLVMDYFAGGTLDERLRTGGPLPVADALSVMRLVAEAMQSAHATNILHRDLKPANLLVRQSNGWRVKVIDFGLAIRQPQVSGSTHASRQERTLIGTSLAGTRDFAAPEQLGRRSDPIGRYSDVYGFGRTFCMALFATTQPLMRHWKTIPTPLAELLERCLEDNPKARPADFTEVLRALESASASPIRASVSASSNFLDISSVKTPATALPEPASDLPLEIVSATPTSPSASTSHTPDSVWLGRFLTECERLVGLMQRKPDDFSEQTRLVKIKHGYQLLEPGDTQVGVPVDIRSEATSLLAPFQRREHALSPAIREQIEELRTKALNAGTRSSTLMQMNTIGMFLLVPGIIFVLLVAALADSEILAWIGLMGGFFFGVILLVHRAYTFKAYRARRVMAKNLVTALGTPAAAITAISEPTIPYFTGQMLSVVPPSMRWAAMLMVLAGLFASCMGILVLAFVFATASKPSIRSTRYNPPEYGHPSHIPPPPKSPSPKK